MIYTNNNQSNQIVCTLNERSVIASTGGTPIYLFELYNQSLKTTSYVFPLILSSNSRYDLLQLTLTSSTVYNNLTGGTICLNSSTYYNYSVYEKGNYNLFVENNDKLLEQGLMTVTSSTASNQFIYTGSSSSFSIYNN